MHHGFLCARSVRPIELAESLPLEVLSSRAIFTRRENLSLRVHKISWRPENPKDAPGSPQPRHGTKQVYHLCTDVAIPILRKSIEESFVEREPLSQMPEV